MNETLNNSDSLQEHRLKLSSSKINETSSQRKDCYGNIISRKIKKHKICFPDNLESKKDLAEVYTVTSYKNIYENCIIH